MCYFSPVQEKSFSSLLEEDVTSLYIQVPKCPSPTNELIRFLVLQKLVPVNNICSLICILRNRFLFSGIMENPLYIFVLLLSYSF